jgi:orotidine-5'-phosphate decarboxylase
MTHPSQSSELSSAPEHIILMAQKKLIVALDFPSAKEALELVARLEGVCHWFKVGLELYLASGNSIVESLLQKGHSVFLDLKFHDIPNTVAGAVRSVASLGAGLLTVHAAGGPAMLRAAREAADAISGAPKLLAVTVLTSMDRSQLIATGVTKSPSNQVLTLGQMAVQAGIPNFVCSPEELTALRPVAGSRGVLVSPGIRPAGADKGDQKRVATPAAAIEAGADYLVVGRPITKAEDPRKAAQEIVEEIAGSYR